MKTPESINVQHAFNPELRQAQQDLDAFIDTRPYLDKGNNLHQPSGKFANKDYFDKNREEHYQASMPVSFEEMSIGELTSKLAEAEFYDDKTTAGDVSDALLGRLSTLAKDANMEVEGQDNLLNRALRLKDQKLDVLRESASVESERDNPSEVQVEDEPAQSSVEVNEQAKEKVEVYDQDKDSDFPEESAAPEAENEPTDEEIDEGIRQRMIDAITAFKTAKVKPMAEIAKEVIEKTFTQLSERREWTPEQKKQYFQEAMAHMKGNADRPLEQLFQPTAEDAEKFSAPEAIWEYSEEMQDALKDYMIAEAINKEDERAAAGKRVDEEFKKAVKENNWNKDEAAAHFAGLTSHMKEMRKAEEPVQEAAPEEAPAPKKSRWQTFKENLKGSKSEAGKVSLVTAPSRERSEKRNYRKTISRYLGIAAVDAAEPYIPTPRTSKKPSEFDEFWNRK